MKLRSYFWLHAMVVGSVVGLVSGRAPAQEKEKKQDKPKPTVTGTWKWNFTMPDGRTIELALKLKHEGDKLSGTYIGREGRESPIEQAKIKDGELSFQVTRERDGQKFTIKYQGKLEGDSIKGKVEAEFGGEARSFDWDAKRAIEKPIFAGTWKWSFTTQQGQTIESTLKLKQEGDKLSGTYIGRGGQESPIEEVKVADGELSFRVTRERDGQKFTAKYQGKLSGDSIKGTSEVEFGGQTRTRDWEAKREPEKKEGEKK